MLSKMSRKILCVFLAIAARWFRVGCVDLKNSPLRGEGSTSELGLDSKSPTLQQVSMEMDP